MKVRMVSLSFIICTAGVMRLSCRGHLVGFLKGYVITEPKEKWVQIHFDGIKRQRSTSNFLRHVHFYFMIKTVWTLDGNPESMI